MEDAGAVYLFKRDPEFRDGLLELISAPTWYDQHAKIYSADMRARDTFGWSVALDNYSSAVGAPGGDTGSENSGASYMIDVEFVTGE